ncbi:molecular chaperone HtpG [Deltaproteobacteria bacterium TL4]
MSEDQAPEEKHEYQAEMKKLLDILVHSLYTEREIFLRELISNASDALSKFQFISLTEPNLLNKEIPLEIKVSFDEKEKVITVEDSGIGMTKEEIIGNIGTVASSGTLKFVKDMKKGEKSVENLIGQFGVGFYSIFMVAQKAVLITRSAHKDQQAWEWTSEGSGSYTLKPSDKKERGTKVQLFLKDEASEFCAEYRLESIIKKYSNYIPFPVVLKEKTINKVKALWTLPKEELKKEDYDDFYKQLTYDYQEPLHYLHLSIDAPIQYYATLYIPKHITNEVLYAREGKGISLYAQRVLIQHDNQNLLPSYLRFIRGVADSEDLPLNVSRESVQNNALIEKIKKSLTSRVLKELKSLSETHVETYNNIWKEYGILIKEGVSSDFGNRDKLIELLRFNTSISDNAERTVSIKDYVGRMREDQKEIYYAIGATRESVLHNPNLEYFKEKGLEVIFLFDHIDDFLMSDLREYEGKSLKSISQSDIEAFKGEKDQPKEGGLSKEEGKDFLKYIKDYLGDRISEVVSSTRLVGSPCSLINAEAGMSSHMEKMMKMVNKDYTMGKKNLEVNLNHKIICNLSKLMKSNKDSVFIKESVEQLYKNALLVEGLLDNPSEILPSVYRFMEEASEFQIQKSS